MNIVRLLTIATLGFCLASSTIKAMDPACLFHEVVPSWSPRGFNPPSPEAQSRESNILRLVAHYGGQRVSTAEGFSVGFCEASNSSVVVTWERPNSMISSMCADLASANEAMKSLILEAATRLGVLEQLVQMAE